MLNHLPFGVCNGLIACVKCGFYCLNCEKSCKNAKNMHFNVNLK